VTLKKLFWHWLSAGDKVTFQLTAINTADLRLRNVQLTVPALLNSTLRCTAAGIPVSSPTAAVLEPGSALHCNASYTVTTADIEGGVLQLEGSAEGSSVLGALSPVVRTLQLQPVLQPMVTVTIVESGLVKPTKSGTAEGVLVVPIELRNTGNVGLLSINLKSPSVACSVPLLEPGAAPYSCVVSVPSTLADFEAGLMDLAVLAEATPRGVGGPTSVTGQAALAVTLVKTYTLYVEAAATPTTVTNAGKHHCCRVAHSVIVLFSCGYCSCTLCFFLAQCLLASLAPLACHSKLHSRFLQHPHDMPGVITRLTDA
jgi:hypothetical protein